jgi:hypothetical protein
MTDRASMLLSGRRELLERILERDLQPPMTGPSSPLPPHIREFLCEEAEDLYWNELEWENITFEEALEDGPLTELAFPGFLAFMRGLLLTEVMPDSLAPALPRPQVVEDTLSFLCGRVVTLEEGLAAGDGDDPEKARSEMEMTSRLIDFVLYRFHELAPAEIERVEAGRRTSA